MNSSPKTEEFSEGFKNCLSQKTVFKVLIVDDNETNLFIMRKILERVGADVATARDGCEALVAVKAWRPVLLLLDISMPGMDGLETARRVRADLGEHAPSIIAVTATDTPYLRDACREVGFDDFIAKPIGMESFISRVTTYMHG